jgi:hypothetical protein
MIKDYGKKIGVYEARAHREMKKLVKRNTRRVRHRTEAERAARKAELKNIAERKRFNINAEKRGKIANEKYAKAMKATEDDSGFYFNSGSSSGSGSGSSADQF